MKRAGNLFGDVVCFENLYQAFRAASRGKRELPEVAHYRYDQEARLLALRDRLQRERYDFGPYRTFHVRDPKPRRIVAAPFEDRIVHHAMCNVLSPAFEPTFIFDSYACRKGKGTHAAVLRLQRFLRRAGSTHVLQCDIRKYFPSTDHAMLKRLIRRKVKDGRLLDLVDRVIDSAPPEPGFGAAKGLPIGNLTSQLFANVYLDPLDHFVKEVLGRRSYVRYVDDFLCLGDTRQELVVAKDVITSFLTDRLQLELHPDKCHVYPARVGVTFLGYRVWPYRIRVKTTTLVRIRRREQAARRAYWEGRITLEEYGRVVSSLLGHVGWGDPSGVVGRQIRS